MAYHRTHTILRSNDHFVTSTCLARHPFTYPLFALATLIGIRCIDEVPAEVRESIHDLESSFLGTFPHHGTPISSEAHSAERERADSN